MTYRFSTYELGRELQYYRASGCKTCALKNRCTAEPGQPDDHARSDEHLMESHGPTDEATAGKFKLRKTLAEHPFRHHQALFWLHALSTERSGEGADGMEPDDAAYNLKRVAEPGGLPEIDGRGGVERPAATPAR